jgi:hypothetical protein
MHYRSAVHVVLVKQITRLTPPTMIPVLRCCFC